MVEVGGKGTRSWKGSTPGGDTLTVYRSRGAISDCNCWCCLTDHTKMFPIQEDVVYLRGIAVGTRQIVPPDSM